MLIRHRYTCYQRNGRAIYNNLEPTSVFRLHKRTVDGVFSVNDYAAASTNFAQSAIRSYLAHALNFRTSYFLPEYVVGGTSTSDALLLLKTGLSHVRK
jgi:hypothetical protein